MNTLKGPDWNRLASSCTEPERLTRWRNAYELWLDYLQAHYSKNVPVDTRTALKEFFHFIDKPIWTITTEDVNHYKLSLEARGLKVNTIRIRFISLKRFFDYCIANGIDEALEITGNPVEMVEISKQQTNAEMNYLTRRDEKRLLGMLKRDPSAIGKRDYAFFLLLLRNGKAVGRVRKMRWGELTFDGTQAWLIDAQTGELENLDMEIWEAILNALRAAGRLEKIQAEEFVFAPSRDPLKYESGEHAEQWVGNRSLSIDETNYLLKRYAGWAGLKIEEVTFHTLRNTAALKMIEAGKDEETIQKRMGRKRKAETHRYIQKLQQNQIAVRNSRKRQLRSYEPIPSRKPGRAPLRNHYNLRHGFYAKYLPEMEMMEARGKHLEGLHEKVVRNMIVCRRIMGMTKNLKKLTFEQGIILTNIMGLAAQRSFNAKIELYYSKPEEIKDSDKK